MSIVETNVPPEAAAAQLVNQLAFGHIPAAALQVALKLAIPDRLADGPRTVAELAAETGTNEDALYRVLRALASLGLFEERTPRVFASNLPAAMLRTGPGSMRNMALWISFPLHFTVYAEMMHSVVSGTPAVEKVTGFPVFEFFPRNPEYSEIFNDAMTGFSRAVVESVLQVYDFTGIGLLVDVAGGHGQVLTSILARYPAMRGVLFDLDHVVAGAAPRIETAGVGDRCRAEQGDFFAAVPAGADAYILKHIIHDWDDARAAAILANVRTALAGVAGGRLLLLESVIQPGNAPDPGKLIDLEMLLMPGGKERTEAEFRALLTRSGFELTRIVPTASPLSVIEARPV